MKKSTPTIILLIIAVAIVGIYYFFFKGVDDSVVTQNEYQKIDREYVSFEDDQKEISKLLLDTYPKKLIETERGKIFCSNKIYGSESVETNGNLKVYLWSFCEEYYLVDTDVEKGNTFDAPLTLTLSKEKGSIEISEITKPEKLDNPKVWIGSNFPKNLASDISVDDAKALQPSPQTQAQNYFKGILEAYF